MPRPSRPWFRFYVEALSDRKLRRLTPAQRWLWIAVLGAARQSPITGLLMVSDREPMDADDLADIAGMTAREVERTLPLFEKAGMLKRDGALDAWCVTNWSERQYESDNSTERTRKHRSEEQRRNVPTTPVGTPPETEADTETEEPPPSTDEIAEEFERFWSHYPARDGKKLNKGEALKQFRRLSAPKREQAMTGVVHYAASGQRAKDAFRWLRDHHFDDWQEPIVMFDDPGPVRVTHVDPLVRPRVPDYERDEVADALPMVAGASLAAQIRSGVGR